MLRTDELKQQITAKRTEMEKLQQRNQIGAAASAADELNALYDEYKIELAKEQANFKNFLSNDHIIIDPNGVDTYKPHSGGISGNEYRKEFFNQFRTGFQTAANYLRESSLAQGGYLVPEEFHDRIIAEITEANVFRKIGSRIISTSAPHKISLLATKPIAYWIKEGASITLSSPTFAQKTLDAFKLAIGLSLSNELLLDSHFDIESFSAQEFGKALALEEECAFLTGTTDDRPAGLIPTLAADSDMTITSSGNSITGDDIVNLIHSVKRPYRRNAAFLMSDSTLAIIRKLKDSTQNYLWQPNFAAGEPERLLGYPIYTSEFLPTATSGNICILFGDWSSYVIGDRAEMTFKALHELHALNDLTTFLALERIDAVLTDNSALRGLKMK